MIFGFILADHSDASFLRLRDEVAHGKAVMQEVPPAYWNLPSFSDGLEGYRTFLSAHLQEICLKGSGKTGIVEGSNTKCRKSQTGLLRKSCSICWRVSDNIVERFLILMDQHNREQIKQYK